MLATFVIGLREGLEAVLVVSIVAAFLKRNGISRRPMWLGVFAAVLICIGVGVGLQAFEQALPQAQQEGLEAIIGVVAVIFVTAMIAWMAKNARGLKREIEAEATEALGRGTGWALAGMAFLAIIKEGFETAVFLLATLQASTSVWAAGLGALLGIAAACLVGYGLYTGGVKLNLGKFFRISSIFLIFVAAGLVLTALRRAHEAGWITIGQQHTVDLSWLAPIGSIRSALITGVLGIPADPRLIEVLGWFAYLVPMLLIAFWPQRWRPSQTMRPVVKFAVAGGLAVAAIVLALVIPTGTATVPATAALSPAGIATLAGNGVPTLHIAGTAASDPVVFGSADAAADQKHGAAVTRWTQKRDAATGDRPATVTLDDLTKLFGRIPVGIDAQQNPGPFEAAWTAASTTVAWTAHGGLVDASESLHTTLTLTGGGLAGSRTLTLDTTTWSVPEAVATQRARALAAGDVLARELTLWRVWLPLALGVAAALVALSAWRELRAARRAARQAASLSGASVSGSDRRSTSYAVR
ncbi:iron uptake transporter permease EfeU [Microbacterium protaetiae]|uniref:iron uptake transporter permease EfeU n=1 Tax=Microbacterium protaetiae TaxID=2509458 RepID=UPI0013EC869C|nr:iron uptake transporter permease EfeU [Microbacterium protaetiae]